MKIKLKRELRYTHTTPATVLAKDSIHGAEYIRDGFYRLEYGAEFFLREEDLEEYMPLPEPEDEDTHSKVLSMSHVMDLLEKEKDTLRNNQRVALVEGRDDSASDYQQKVRQVVKAISDLQEFEYLKRHHVAGEDWYAIPLRTVAALNERRLVGEAPDKAAARIIAERDAWETTAAQNQRNCDFYQGIVTQIGEMFGEEAKTADDGSVGDSVLALKVPELVAKLLPPKTYRILDNGEVMAEGDQVLFRGHWVSIGRTSIGGDAPTRWRIRRLWNPTETYRRLAIGEIIREEDEALVIPLSKWKRLPLAIGKPITENSFTFRRKVVLDTSPT